MTNDAAYKQVRHALDTQGTGAAIKHYNALKNHYLGDNPPLDEPIPLIGLYRAGNLLKGIVEASN